MRASMRRWHHSISPAPRGELAAQDLAFGFELRQRADRPARAAGPVVRRAPTRVTGRWIRSSRAGSRRRRLRDSESRGRRRDRRMRSRRDRLGARSRAARSRPRSRGRRVSVDARLGACELRRNHAATRATGGSMIKRQQRVVQFVGIAHHGPRFRGHLRDRRRIERADASRHNRPAACAASAPRARGALRAARRPDTRTDWRSESRGEKGDGSRRIDRDGADRALVACARRIAFRPSRSIASCRQLSMVSFTSG